MSGSGFSRTALDRIVRRERGRLVADLVNRLGPQHVDLAEDVAQDALVTAMATWPYRGMPDNPGAWLATVARNRAYDRLRRERRETPLLDDEPDPGCDVDDAVSAASLGDPELRLMFLCCHEALTELERLTLTLKLVSGFTAREIGEALLAADAAVGQRLARAKRKLRGEGRSLAEVSNRFAIAARLRTALKVVYLMFGLGYAPRSGERLLRHEVLNESLRLAREIVDNPATAAPEAFALAALLCFQSSRADARENDEGHIVLFADQDRSRWNGELIREGLAYLQASQQAATLSRYHLEAGIASLYATAKSWQECDWHAIGKLYEQLEAVTTSPVVTINACVAQAMAGDPSPALARLEVLSAHDVIRRYAPYYIALAETQRLLGNDDAAVTAYQAALDCGLAAPVQTFIEERLIACL